MTLHEEVEVEGGLEEAEEVAAIVEWDAETEEVVLGNLHPNSTTRPISRASSKPEVAALVS